MAQAPWLAPSLSQADQGGAGGRSCCWKVVGKYRGGTKGIWPEFKKSSNRILCTDVILRKVSRNMSTGANHGDGVKLCAVYQRIEDPFLGSSWSIFRSSVGVWYLLCFAHGNWWWNFVAESDQLNMGHDNIWYSRPRKFGAGSRKCKACSNGCVQFLISETFGLMLIFAGMAWSGNTTWTCAGSASMSTPRTSASRSWTSHEYPTTE